MYHFEVKSSLFPSPNAHTKSPPPTSPPSWSTVGSLGQRDLAAAFTTRHPFHKPFSLLPACMLILLCVCITEPTNNNGVVLKFRLRFSSQEKLSVANDVLSWSFATFLTASCAVCYLEHAIPAFQVLKCAIILWGYTSSEIFNMI